MKILLLLSLIVSGYSKYQYVTVQHDQSWSSVREHHSCVHNNEFIRNLNNVIENLPSTAQNINPQCGFTGSSSTHPDHGWLMCECLIFYELPDELENINC